MPEETTAATTDKAVNHAFAALLLTVTAYCAAFAYEAAFLSDFGVPAVLAQVDLRELLLCLGFLGGGGGILLLNIAS